MRSHPEQLAPEAFELGGHEIGSPLLGRLLQARAHLGHDGQTVGGAAALHAVRELRHSLEVALVEGAADRLGVEEAILEVGGQQVPQVLVELSINLWVRALGEALGLGWRRASPGAQRLGDGLAERGLPDGLGQESREPRSDDRQRDGEREPTAGPGG